MNRILFEEQSDSYRLDPDDPRFDHVRGVLRLNVGDRFDVGLVNGPVGKATVRELDAQSVRFDVAWGERPSLPPDIRLLVGLCRPATVRKILTAGPTLGVRELHFAECGRSDPAYRRSRLWTSGEWRERLIEGVGQAFDTFVPEVGLHANLADALDRIPGEACRLALDVYEGTRRLGEVRLPQGRPVCLAIGPERGWDANDRKLLGEHGFRLVSLGKRVLRVETAVVAGLALLLREMGEF